MSLIELHPRLAVQLIGVIHVNTIFVAFGNDGQPIFVVAIDHRPLVNRHVPEYDPEGQHFPTEITREHRPGVPVGASIQDIGLHLLHHDLLLARLADQLHNRQLTGGGIRGVDSGNKQREGHGDDNEQIFFHTLSILKPTKQNASLLLAVLAKFPTSHMKPKMLFRAKNQLL